MAVRDDPDQSPRAGWTLLRVAAYADSQSVISYLVKRGDEVETRDLQENTALHMSCYPGHADSCRFLIDAKAAGSLGKDTPGAGSL